MLNISSFVKDKFKSTCYVLIILIILILFFQNFLFSKSFELIAFREIDDLAFQFSIRQVHQNIFNGDFYRLLVINDYAYGWIYWICISIVTFPFYLLSQSLNIDWLLISFPRQISLFFIILSLVTLRKILKVYKVPEWACAGALLTFLLLPYVGYFSMRFGTVSAVMFFSMLSFYFSIREKKLDFNELIKISISLSIAGSIKLTGFLIAPLIAVNVYRRIRLENNKIPNWIYYKSIPLFLIFSISLTAPQLIFSIIKPKFFINYLNNLQYFIGVTKITSGSEVFWGRIYEGIFGSPGVLIVIIILFIALISESILITKSGDVEKNNSKLVYIVSFVILIGIYLGLTVKNSLSLGSYFTSIFFIFILGYLFIIRSKKSILIFAFIILILLFDISTRMQNEYKYNGTHWNHFSYLIKYYKSSEKIDLAKNTQKCIQEKKPLNEIKHILMDFSVPTFINAITLPNVRISLIWNDLSADKISTDPPIDFIILDNNSIGSLDQRDFDDKTKNIDKKLASNYALDRFNRNELERNGKFKDQFFVLICDFGLTKIFMKK